MENKKVERVLRKLLNELNKGDFEWTYSDLDDNSIITEDPYNGDMYIEIFVVENEDREIYMVIDNCGLIDEDEKYTEISEVIQVVREMEEEFYEYEDELYEDATQVSDVNAGRVSVLGDKEEVNKIEEESNVGDDFVVTNSTTFNTSEYEIIECGTLQNGEHFVLDESGLYITDEDFAKAYKSGKVEDIEEWLSKHTVLYYTSFEFIYEYIAEQTKAFN